MLVESNGGHVVCVVLDVPLVRVDGVVRGIAGSLPAGTGVGPPGDIGFGEGPPGKAGGRVSAPVRRIRGCVQVVWWWILGADTAETSSCGSCCRPGRLLKIRPPRSRCGFAARVVVACAYRVHRAVFVWCAGVGSEQQPQGARKGSALSVCGLLLVVLSGVALLVVMTWASVGPCAWCWDRLCGAEGCWAEGCMRGSTRAVKVVAWLYGCGCSSTS